MKKRMYISVLRLVLMVFMGFCTPLSILAQYGTGLLEDDSTYQTHPVMSDYDGSKALDLPKKVSLRSYCPTAGNQGMIPSCVGWSVGYAVYTIERAVQNKWTDASKINAEASSAMYLYNGIKKGNDCPPLSMSKAMDWLKANGNCLAKDFDKNASDCSRKPTDANRQAAKKFVLSDFQCVFDIKADRETKINNLRMVLAKNKPVAVGILINKAITGLKDAEYWYPNVGDKPTEGHAVTVVGYDDATNHFLVFNSWGTGWGKSGYIKVKYNDFADVARSAYTVFLEKKQFKSLTYNGIKENPALTTASGAAPEPDTTFELVEIAGRLDINRYEGKSPLGELIFEPTEVDFVNNHYVLRRKDWQVGQLFQLALTSQFSGAYLYILSVNPQGEAKVLFPRNEDFNPKFVDKHESPLIMLDGARVVLPSPTSALKVEYAGSEWICVLFSLKKINNLPKICELLQDAGDDFPQRINDLLGSHKIPQTDTNFNASQIEFSTATRTGAAILPIIIECRAQ